MVLASIVAHHHVCGVLISSGHSCDQVPKSVNPTKIEYNLKTSLPKDVTERKRIWQYLTRRSIAAKSFQFAHGELIHAHWPTSSISIGWWFRLMKKINQWINNCKVLVELNIFETTIQCIYQWNQWLTFSGHTHAPQNAMETWVSAALRCLALHPRSQWAPLGCLRPPGGSVIGDEKNEWRTSELDGKWWHETVLTT